MNYKAQIRGKSRGNWNIGICLEGCECQSCKRKEREKIVTNKDHTVVWAEKG